MDFRTPKKHDTGPKTEATKHNVRAQESIKGSINVLGAMPGETIEII